MGMERALTYDLFEQLKNSRNKFAFVASKPECADEIFGSVHVLFWHVAWADQDELRALLGWQAVIDREKMARTNSWTASGSELAFASRLATTTGEREAVRRAVALIPPDLDTLSAESLAGPFADVAKALAPLAGRLAIFPCTWSATRTSI